MADETDVLLEATTSLVPPLLVALDGLAFAGRHLHPPQMAEVVAAIEDLRAPLTAGLETFTSAPWPAQLQGFAGQIEESARDAVQAFEGLTACLTQSNPAMGAYRAMSFATRAIEALYPVAFMLPPVNRYFISAPWRDDAQTLARLATEDPEGEAVGIVHASNDKTERGGFSVYIPEYYTADQSWPLVVALHGGSGHGRSFLWSWLRDARTRGVILVSATSVGDTWSLMGPDADAANLAGIVDFVTEQWSVDRDRILLTGMSDGGTYSYVTGLPEDSPFTHLAPISASFHPMLLEGTTAARLQGLPVYLTHGALDWMFPVDVARTARDTLSAAGADVEYRELADLSHTYPREENDRILSWLLGQPLTGPSRDRLLTPDPQR
jgi:phospholipase/carboxylesterase